MNKPQVFTIGLAAIAVAMSLISIAANQTSGARSTEKAPSVTQTMPMTAAEHTAEAIKLEQEAADLELKARQHTDELARYRTLAGTGSKSSANFRSLAMHCAVIVKAYRTTAAEALAMANSHRALAKRG